ncbi:hypothetical protein STEG23_006998, partial [Scotinomys teguina]
MEKPNLTVVAEFILLGINDRPELQAPLFGLFLIIYLFSLVGNMGMIILTMVDPRLQTPMYFFLRHLAITDLGYSTAVGPKMLVNFVVDQNTITNYLCATQLTFFLVFIICELFILSAMSYDRYVAICKPLLYTVIMSQRLSFFLMFIISELFILSAMAYDRYVAICSPLLYNVIMSQRLCHVLVGIPYLYSTFQALLFTIFLTIYTITVVGNLGMIILTKLDSHLHTPMYFFIRHLAFIDLGNSTAICPKMLVNFVVDQNTITYYACATQMACFILFIVSELSILSSMAYDRYVAICNPLLYSAIMSQRRCHALVAVPYLYSTFQALLFPIKYFTLTFCGTNVISHFYCDVVPLLPLICSQVQETELLTILFSAFNLISSLLVVLLSYMLILLTILRMHSAEGRKKAFSTCGSHLTVVVVFYGSLIFMYVQPKSTHSFETDKMASVFYTLVIPMLNPLIYSLRNKE